MRSAALGRNTSDFDLGGKVHLKELILVFSVQNNAHHYCSKTYKKYENYQAAFVNESLV